MNADTIIPVIHAAAARIAAVPGIDEAAAADMRAAAADTAAWVADLGWVGAAWAIEAAAEAAADAGDDAAYEQGQSAAAEISQME